MGNILFWGLHFFLFRVILILEFIFFLEIVLNFDVVFILGPFCFLRSLEISCIVISDHTQTDEQSWFYSHVALVKNKSQLSKPQLNYKSTQPQPNITLVGKAMKMTLHTPHPTTNHTNSMSTITQLLLTRFWLNFKGSFQGTSRKDSN